MRKTKDQLSGPIRRCATLVLLSAIVTIAMYSIEPAASLAVGGDGAVAKIGDELPNVSRVSINTTHLSNAGLRELISALNSKSTNLAAVSISGRVDQEVMSAIAGLRPVNSISFVSIKGECKPESLKRLQTKNLRFCYAYFLEPEHIEAAAKNSMVTNIVSEFCGSISLAKVQFWRAGPSLRIINDQGVLEWRPLSAKADVQ